MITINRRNLVPSGLAAAAARTAHAATGRVEILSEETIGVIPPDIYGHFVGLPGGSIYNGIRVDEKPPVANGGTRGGLTRRYLSSHRGPGGPRGGPAARLEG